MISILTGSILISLLHAIIPSHWLPVLVIGRQEQWTLREVTQVTFFSAFAHAFSTVAIGLALGMIGHKFSRHIDQITHYIAPITLIAIGLFFLYRHHHHQHFQIDSSSIKTQTKKRIIVTLSMAMFLSPCMEIEAYFLLAGTISVWLLLVIAFIYFVVTISGMVMLVSIAYKGILKIHSHRLEHNAGMITGFTLIATGIISFFIH